MMKKTKFFVFATLAITICALSGCGGEIPSSQPPCMVETGKGCRSVENNYKESPAPPALPNWPSFVKVTVDTPDNCSVLAGGIHLSRNRKMEKAQGSQKGYEQHTYSSFHAHFDIPEGSSFQVSVECPQGSPPFYIGVEHKGRRVLDETGEMTFPESNLILERYQKVKEDEDFEWVEVPRRFEGDQIIDEDVKGPSAKIRFRRIKF